MRIAVLFATRNGERFLAEQLRSLAEQTVPELDIWASDDASTDATWTMLSDAAGTWAKGEFRLLRGPAAGTAAANFRSLVLAVPPAYDYFAFADQDDLWHTDKLERAIAEMGPDREFPVLHCSRTELIDDVGNHIGLSTYFRRPPDFRNALVQSLAGGNTMVLNASAFRVVHHACEKAAFVSHDWWTYQIVTGCGGHVVYKERPNTKYRQHADNDIGANLGTLARLRRMKALFEGRFESWNSTNIAGLRSCASLLVPDALRTLDRFEAARVGPVVARLRNLKISGVYRQTGLGNLGLALACVLRRL